MKSTDIFPSKYLRAADLDGREPVVTIDRATLETLGDERKVVVYFKGKDKGLVLNKTNFNAIEEISGEDDTDNWAGTKVKLFTAKVEFQGKRVPAVRIDSPDDLKRAAALKSKDREETVEDELPEDLDNTPF